MSDVCHEKIPTEIIRLGFGAIAASAHFGMFCSKRVQRMAAVLSAASAEEVRLWQPKCLLGFTAPGQPEFDERWPVMRALAEQGWFVYASLSPLLEPITPPEDFWQLACWVIVSGEQDEQGVRGRDMRPEWAEAILDKCDQVGMPFFFRQMSGSGAEPIPNKLLRRDFPQLKSRSPQLNLTKVPLSLPTQPISRSIASGDAERDLTFSPGCPVKFNGPGCRVRFNPTSFARHSRHSRLRQVDDCPQPTR